MLSINHIYKTYHTQRPSTSVPAIIDVNFQVGDGEFVSIIGPSGCGKSTLFKLIVGLEEPDEGTIALNGQPLSKRAGLFGYMPQRDLLLPWRTVLDNAVLGPEISGVHRALARQEAIELLPLFGLAGFGDVYPSTLSGGMRQRAALLRTFLCQRDIMLLDEPFGALDALTRRVLQQWLLGVWEHFQKTILFITHDVDEALLLSDRVIVLSPRPGRILFNQAVTIPRPRTQDIFVKNEYIQLKSAILDGLGFVE
ncbi:MAG: ABC transporter ATP-binding protein [Chloroflexota bacterium]